MIIKYIIYFLIIFIGGGIGISRWKLSGTWHRLLTVLLLLTLLSELGARCVAHYNYNNSPFYHLFAPIQYTLLALIYFYKIRSETVKKLVLLSIPFFIIYHFINTFYIQSWMAFPSNSLLILSVCVLLESLFLFSEFLNHSLQDSLLGNGVFWFNMGNLVFYSGTFLFWSFHNALLMQIPEILFTLLYVMNLFLYICYAIALGVEAYVRK